MDNVVESISRDETLRDMEMWKASRYAVFGEFETLWKMFRAVVENSSYGTSEYGGPVWVLDFSLKNLKKFYPDNIWLEAMEQELDKGKLYPEVSDLAKSNVLVMFSSWFCERATAMIEDFGLGNVIAKYDGLAKNIYLYGNNIFLSYIGLFVNGEVLCPGSSRLSMGDNFHFSSKELLDHGDFYTYLVRGFMWQEYPNCAAWFRLVPRAPMMQHEIYGECYLLPHLGMTKGFVVSETDKVKYLTLVVKDTMDAIQNNPAAVNSILKRKCLYPQMQYYDKGWIGTAGAANRSDVFEWRCQNGLYKKVKVILPKIDDKYGKFWHLQFPLKQNWVVVGQPAPEYIRDVFR